jgi:hypothetical protein
MMSLWLLGVKDETGRRADRQGGVQHDHPDRERSNPALHG